MTPPLARCDHDFFELCTPAEAGAASANRRGNAGYNGLAMKCGGTCFVTDTDTVVLLQCPDAAGSKSRYCLSQSTA
jgi:hypothetical protein